MSWCQGFLRRQEILIAIMDSLYIIYEGKWWNIIVYSGIKLGHNHQLTHTKQPNVLELDTSCNSWNVITLAHTSLTIIIRQPCNEETQRNSLLSRSLLSIYAPFVHIRWASGRTRKCKKEETRELEVYIVTREYGNTWKFQ